MDDSGLQLVSEIGTKLRELARPKKDSLAKLLRQAAMALSQIEQPSCLEAAKKQEAIKKLEAATVPLRNSIIKHKLCSHSDNDVRLFTAICVSETFRILAPEPPFEDKYLRDIFKVILSVFMELADITSPYFSRRVKIVETIAQCKCCVIMLDIDCNDLILQMFNIFFFVVRDYHQQSLINDILSILTHILNEEASHPIVDVILKSLIGGDKDGSSLASQLAVSVIKSCTEKLQPFVCGFLTSCFLDRDAVGSELKEFYHEIIFKICQCAPEMLFSVIPNLIQELQTDQVDVRIKAVNLIGKLISLPEFHFAQRYRDLFVEFLKRFSDISAEVRVAALQCVKACYLANPSGTESNEILSVLGVRLLDFDDKVRSQAVSVVCDLARSHIKFFSPKLISDATERVRDKKASVRKKALQKLMELYRDYCSKCSEGCMIPCDHFEQIPCKTFMLCCDKDCKEFRSQNMEHVLMEELFPPLLPVEERTRHWIHFFSLFSPLHVKALEAILSQKRRLQTEMKNYLALRKNEKEKTSEGMEKSIKNCFVKMSTCFPEPSKAGECFYRLNQMKNNNIFNALERLLDEVSIINAQATRDQILKIIGDKHQDFEFIQLLTSKCMFNIFNSEHVQCILSHISSKSFADKHLEASSVELLLVAVSIFPALLKGSEAQFCMLFKGNCLFNDKFIQVLAKAGSHISVKFSDVYPYLKKICLEGTRAQSKLAVSAIASLIATSEQCVFSELCKELAASLHSRNNIPTILQSLGCIAQHSVSAFESQYKEITSYIYDNIFQANPSEDCISLEETDGYDAASKLKIYGLKTLVKSFLPHPGSQVNRQIDPLLDILSKMLQKGDIFDNDISCESGKAHVRLAAAKSVLRLSRKWDLHISADIFRFTVLTAKDTSYYVRRSFLDKIHKLLKKHAIPIRYACAFAVATSDCLKDLQDDSCKYMAEFIKDYSKEARTHQTSALQGGSILDYPAYIVVYLVHVLAHDTDFPPEDCQDEKIYAQSICPLFSVLQALVNASIVDGDLDVINEAALHLLYGFCAIKKAEDAVDMQITSRLHFLADIGISLVHSLHRNKILSSRAPGLILLPSSLYKMSLSKKSEEANPKYPTPFNLDQSFVKRVAHTFKSHFPVPANSIEKHARKCSDDDPNMVSSMKIDKTSTTIETQEKIIRRDTSLGHRQRRAVSPKENVSGGGSLTAEPFEGTKIKFGTRCTSEVLVGQRIKIWSPIDSCFSSGTVDSYNSQNNTHKITYDNGEFTLLCLDSELWETLSDSSLTERASDGILADKSNTGHMQHCVSETMNTSTDDASQNLESLSILESGKFSSRSSPLAAKERKGKRVSRDTSTNSNIIILKEHGLRRSQRRQKV